jgi:hypothetical protein
MRPAKDPADRLRRANPMPTEEADAPDSPRAEALFQRIIATPIETTPQRRSVLRRRAWVLVPVALLALAAASYGLLREVREPLVIACYRRPSLSTDRATVPAAADAVAACRTMWQPGGPFNQGRGAPPPLTACVLDSGAIGVFPDTVGSDVCDRLGLSHPASGRGGQLETQALIALQNQLSTRFVSRCVHQADALAFAQDGLAKSGLTGWRVIVATPFTEQEPCASVAIDPPRRTVTLVPVPESR